ncbi:hypothetical protein K505DRAFT_330216 [Melanomma pulvis-pyrius CBS 109.77]|uniref:Pyridoxamine 5'-phosphate oxidase N-terminal domain-containing protein n=1 Tax=Melanomma pulvis-pyrius CBS 109.77 TaxID=1314802 RepID=A0A6A6WRD7_9PLEO|nr:hypothetical protein K505DRAFT_330216 [Melanomma pulvis-pyrius CBS 109.77]
MASSAHPAESSAYPAKSDVHPDDDDAYPHDDGSLGDYSIVTDSDNSFHSEDEDLSPPKGVPDDVITCLKNGRYLHLSTCADNVPHISLMNYTYLPRSKFDTGPIIIMSTPMASRKTHNMLNNPVVSILVHDWVSHRAPTLSQPAMIPHPEMAPHPAISPHHVPPAHSQGLAELLLGMNTACLSRISSTINGIAEVVPSGSDEEAVYKALHVDHNCFESDDAAIWAASPAVGLWGYDQSVLRGMDDSNRCFMDDKETRVVVVRIIDGKIADLKGEVRNWSVDIEIEEPPVTNGN